MANVNHADLTGSQLHEPKGVATAAANTVYTANGAGSGAWTDVNTLLTTTNFTTGDAKLTLKTVADSGWVLMNDGTIGDALSAATTRANDDTEDLFTLLWNNVSNTYAAVSGGRGANAAADWAAHKTIALTKVLGRAFIGAGAGSGLTSRGLGETGGNETEALLETHLPPHTHTGTTANANTAHTHTVSVTDPGHTHTVSPNTVFRNTGGGNVASGVNIAASVDTLTTLSATTGITAVADAGGAVHTHSFTTSSIGGGTAHNNVQPFSAWNIMIKL